MKNIKGTGFYIELDRLLKNDPYASFDFLLDEYAGTEISADVFLHGCCNVFAAELSKNFGYQIEEIRDFENHLVHSYCTADFNGNTTYIDIRGITTNASRFFDEFSDVTVSRGKIEESQFEDGWLSVRRFPSYKVYSSEHQYLNNKEIDILIDAARLFIDENRDFYDISVLDKEKEHKMDPLDSKIIWATIQSKKQNNILLTEKEFDIGLNVDKTLCILVNGKEIGKCAISEMIDPDEIYLEWIEFAPEYRGKHLLRPTLLALCDCTNCKYIVLESTPSNALKYIHLGAEKTIYNDFSEMQGFRLSVNELKNSKNHQMHEVIRY